MKIRIILPVSVCLFVIILSATMGAQQTGNASSDNSSSVSQSGREPIPSEQPKDFWDGDDPNLGNLLIHPFATKAYIRRHTEPIHDRLNELDSITAENTRAIKDADSRAQQGLQMASEKESLADQHATDASTRAQGAQAAATQASTRVTSAEQMVGNLDQYRGDAQTEIRFRAGQSALSKNAKDALDQMAAGLKDQHSYIIEVRGFAAGRGQSAIASSQKMADSVVRYLVLTHQIPVYRIYTMGVGNAAMGESGGSKQASGGRVEVSVMRNQVASAGSH